MKTQKMAYDFAPDQLKPKESMHLELNLSRLDSLLSVSGSDAIILTSKDPFISEYVPLLNHQRYGATGFSGSTGDCIYWSESFRKKNPNQKTVSLFVDGRYHLQADQETDPRFVEVVKLDVEPNIEKSIYDRFKANQKLKIAVDPERVSVATLDGLKKIAVEHSHVLQFIKGEEILKALNLPGWITDRPIFSLPETSTGRTPAKIFLDLNNAMKAHSGSISNLHITCATDDAAFLLNSRGYHMPNQSSFFAYTFLFHDRLVLFLPAASATCEVNLDAAQLGNYQVLIIRNSIDKLKFTLQTEDVSHVFFDGDTMNGLLPELISEVYPSAKINSNWNWVNRTRTRKTSQEMDSIRRAFLNSSQAIAKTLRYGKSQTETQEISELDLSDYLYQSYLEKGATSLSFTTICGAGPNSAIVHYTNPQATHKFKKGQIALLDSGAYYQDGFCTDCTRGFFVGSKSGSKPEAWQKEIYTATLKAAISVFLKPMDASLSGIQVDAFVRSQVKAKGYDYLHGTGHGVGIHVHEPGIRFSTLSIYPQSDYACVSVEPGIYLKDQGGVRIENIVLLIPEGKSHYRYENVVFVGYDWDLIDLAQLTAEEKSYLKSYESKCREMGTQLTDCPL